MKEPIQRSVRFKVFVAGVILEVLLLLAPTFGLDIDPETLGDVAGWLAGIIMTFIASRTYRNKSTA